MNKVHVNTWDFILVFRFDNHAKKLYEWNPRLFWLEQCSVWLPHRNLVSDFDSEALQPIRRQYGQLGYIDFVPFFGDRTRPNSRTHWHMLELSLLLRPMTSSFTATIVVDGTTTYELSSAATMDRTLNNEIKMTSVGEKYY